MMYMIGIFNLRLSKSKLCNDRDADILFRYSERLRDNNSQIYFKSKTYRSAITTWSTQAESHSYIYYWHYDFKWHVPNIFT